MRSLDLPRATFAVAVPAVAAALVLANPGATSASPAVTPARVVSFATPHREIAAATARDFRVTVTAARTGSGRAPAATVYVTAYTRHNGIWERLDEMRLGAYNGFFWDSLTGPHAVRDLVISNSGYRAGSVQLLLSPALGWSPTYQFHLSHWMLVS